LQGEECPPNGPDQDLLRGSLPGRRQEHPGPVQVLHWRGAGKDFRLDSNTYVVYSLGKHNTNHVCPKAKSILAVQITSGRTVHLKLNSVI